MKPGISFASLHCQLASTLLTGSTTEHDILSSVYQSGMNISPYCRQATCPKQQYLVAKLI